MEPLAVLGVVVLVFAAGIGVGVAIGSRRARSEPTVRAVDPRGPRALQAVDALVADSIGRLAGWLRSGSGPAGAGIRLGPDGTLALLFTDIVGSTRLNVRLGDDAFAQLLRRHDTAVRDLVAAHDGHVVKTQGDGVFAVFETSHDAVACALDLREAMADPGTAGRTLQLRVGVHLGHAVTAQGDVFGESVAFAARVAAAARDGEVLASSEVRHRVEAAVDDLRFSSRVLPTRLKGIPGWHRLHGVRRAS